MNPSDDIVLKFWLILVSVSVIFVISIFIETMSKWIKVFAACCIPISIVFSILSIRIYEPTALFIILSFVFASIPIIIVGLYYLIPYLKENGLLRITIISIICSILIAIPLTFFINCFFLQYDEPIIGANTYCYTIDENNCYHNRNCSYLQNEKFKLSISEAIDLGYEQCEHCLASTELSRTCYTTDYGECYHSLGCNSLWNSSNETNVYSAISRGYTACSKCMYSPNLSLSCYTTASDDYFHSYFCKYIDNTPIESNQTTVYEAITNNYTECKLCKITDIDTSYKTINQYNKSFLLSFIIATMIGVVNFVIQYIHSNKKTKQSIRLNVHNIALTYYMICNSDLANQLSQKQILFATAYITLHSSINKNQISLSTIKNIITYSIEGKPFIYGHQERGMRYYNPYHPDFAIISLSLQLIAIKLPIEIKYENKTRIFNTILDNCEEYVYKSISELFSYLSPEKVSTYIIYSQKQKEINNLLKTQALQLLINDYQ